MPSTTPAINSITGIVVLMFSVATLRLPLLQASLSRDGVEEYNISRRGRYDTDSFRIIYKTGFECPSDVCANASAWVDSSTACGCICISETPTFLPELGSCGDTASVKNSLFGNCSEALGLESGKINDSQLNSSHSFPGYDSSRGRLNNEKAWCTVTMGHYFEIDLVEVRHVSAIATQGFKGNFHNYVKTFEIKYSYDGETWFDYKDKNNNKKKFTGNSDTDTIKYNYFKATFETRFFRIYPKEYNTRGYRCLRVEVYGCTDNAGFTVFVTTLVTVKESSTSTGKKDAKTKGDYSGFSGVMIAVAVACAVVFGIFLIVLVVFCNRKKLKNSQQETKPAVITRNPVVEIYDQIPIERPIDRSSTSSEQDSQSTYQGLVNNSVTHKTCDHSQQPRSQGLFSLVGGGVGGGPFPAPPSAKGEGPGDKFGLSDT
ncbi:Coagulation factor V [Stylophora pistillata]|uniref:Coagulation factor V n=1 Tax=Stylophora pistillata TaxID=50429 RepID=A0A2B4RAN9_STYPI|nr:Coagulation factor V [Stylophora pistillata]